MAAARQLGSNAWRVTGVMFMPSLPNAAMIRQGATEPVG
jgi:hypothetical protein